MAQLFQAMFFTPTLTTTNTLHEFLVMEDDKRCSKFDGGQHYTIYRIEGRVTWLSDFEEAFKDCMDGPLNMDPTVLASLGFSASDHAEYVCKACKQLSRSRGGKCCDGYCHGNRGKKKVIFNMTIS